MTQTLLYTAAACAAIVGGVEAFAPASSSSRSIAASSTTELHFGLPSFDGPKKDAKDLVGEGEGDEKKIGLKGVIQLVMAGAGSPFLGDFEGVDKDTGTLNFSLEANNLVDSEGKSKQTSMPYFESGWIDPDDLAKEEKRKSEGFKFPWQN